jgi:Type IV secretion-system coupling protein DNA-binding domain
MALAFACAATWPDPIQTLSQGGSMLRQLLLNLLLVTIGAPLLLVTILWFTAGTLLARFDQELTKKLPDDRTEWDNYVERIINSGDDLETEHILVGTSQVGDYPVLVHREIYNQHLHVLGDSGASKTSLGMAPTATQLIARGESTVVIVDLKGDKALFEMCRREAARSQLRFRWISNEVGHNSFVFNPFLQSHNQRLSTQQFVDELLQGLSLDYGLAYGAGYYTAMNQIVLTNVLKHVRVRSFRELDGYLENQKFYAKVGHAEDWAQARHLGALVTRLAATEAVNVVPGMYPHQPEVHTQAIDALNVFEQPQVVYLWLRSSVESSNAPAIARLFLWAMFSAASQAKLAENQRVYFFMDEFQQVLSDGIKLIFEQFRDLGGTIIAAHQTAAQLNRQGTDLGETVDSCTAVKQVFRASNLDALERLEKLAGNRLAKVAHWVQPYEPPTGDLVDRLDMFYADEGMINVRQSELPALDRQRMLAISSNRLASLIRFTFGSGYTQFAGASVPIVSQYAISHQTYKDLRKLPWPTAPGTFVVPAPAKPIAVRPPANHQPTKTPPAPSSSAWNARASSTGLRSSRSRFSMSCSSKTSAAVSGRS